MPELIGFYKLDTWWNETFTETEREFISSQYREILASGDSSGKILTEGEESNFKWAASEDISEFLAGITALLQKDSLRPLAYKILEKAESLVTVDTPSLALHYLYYHKIETTYRDAQTPEGKKLCIEACLQQIAVASDAAVAFRSEYHGGMVEHNGYKRLAMLYEQDGDFVNSSKVCKRALDQGWLGDWEERINRCHLRAEKAANRATKEQLRKNSSI